MTHAIPITLIVCALAAIGCGYNDEFPSNYAAAATRTYSAPAAQLIPAIQKGLKLAGYDVELIARDFSMLRTKPKPIAQTLLVTNWGRLHGAATSLRLFIHLTTNPSGQINARIVVRRYINGILDDDELPPRVLTNIWKQIHDNIKDVLAARYVAPTTKESKDNRRI